MGLYPALIRGNTLKFSVAFGAAILLAILILFAGLRMRSFPAFISGLILIFLDCMMLLAFHNIISETDFVSKPPA